LILSNTTRLRPDTMKPYLEGFRMGTTMVLSRSRLRDQVYILHEYLESWLPRYFRAQGYVIEKTLDERQFVLIHGIRISIHKLARGFGKKVRDGTAPQTPEDNALVLLGDVQGLGLQEYLFSDDVTPSLSKPQHRHELPEVVYATERLNVMDDRSELYTYN